MKEFIDELYKQNFTDRTLRSILLLVHDERPGEAETIFKNVKSDEMTKIKQKMRIIHPNMNIKLKDGCDSCPDDYEPVQEMQKIILPSDKIQIEAKSETISDAVGEIMNKFDSDKDKMIEYARDMGYPVRMNYSALRIAQIIAENE